MVCFAGFFLKNFKFIIHIEYQTSNLHTAPFQTHPDMFFCSFYETTGVVYIETLGRPSLSFLGSDRMLLVRGAFHIIVAAIWAALNISTTTFLWVKWTSYYSIPNVLVALMFSGFNVCIHVSFYIAYSKAIPI